MGGRHRPAIGRRPSAAPGPPAPGQGPRPKPTRMLRAPGPRAQTSFLVLPPLSLAAQGPPGLPAEPGCRVPAETYQGKVLRTVVRAARRRGRQRASPRRRIRKEGGRAGGPAPCRLRASSIVIGNPSTAHPSPRLVQSSSRTRLRCAHALPRPS